MAETEAENAMLRARIEMLEKGVSSLFLGSLRQSKLHGQLEHRIDMLKACISRALANDNWTDDCDPVSLPARGAS
jgi:hypothetical protein